jgi:hypothetical protein
MKKVVILIDGFNVYHALQKDEKLHKYKWLDYCKLAKCFVPSKDTIVDVYYFTAFAHWNQRKMTKHKIYLKALTMVGVKTVFGKFKEGVFIFSNPADQKSHVEAFTYKE